MNGRIDACTAQTIAPVARRFVLVTVIGTALFVALGPEPSSGLGWLMAAVYWCLSLGTGLALASGASAGLSRVRFIHDRPVAWQLAAAGLIGLMLFIPFAQAIEMALPAPWQPDDTEDWLDAWEALGGWRAYVAEALQAGPAYLLTWALVNVAQCNAAGTGRNAAEAPPIGVDRDVAAIEHVAAGDAIAECAAAAQRHSPDHVESPSASDTEQTGDTRDFWSRLPPAIGRELITLRADLHYLQVTTRRGRATVLDTLGNVEAQLESIGLRVHRSHWVADASVRRLAKTQAGWFCEMTNGDRVPVSRRRVAQAQARYGTGFIAVPAAVDAPSSL